MIIFAEIELKIKTNREKQFLVWVIHFVLGSDQISYTNSSELSEKFFATLHNFVKTREESKLREFVSGDPRCKEWLALDHL